VGFANLTYGGCSTRLCRTLHPKLWYCISHFEQELQKKIPFSQTLSILKQKNISQCNSSLDLKGDYNARFNFWTCFIMTHKVQILIIKQVSWINLDFEYWHENNGCNEKLGQIFGTLQLWKLYCKLFITYHIHVDVPIFV
jgi:hypothetical protein